MSRINKMAAVLLFLWMGLIFYMSAQTAEVSGESSTEIAETIAPIVVPGYEEMSTPAQIDTIHVLDHRIRKTAHAAEYAILAVLVMSTIPNRYRRKTLYALLFCVIYASSDEFHQLFVPGRAGMIQDVVIDSLGALLGVGLSSVVLMFRAKSRGKQSSSSK